MPTDTCFAALNVPWAMLLPVKMTWFLVPQGTIDKPLFDLLTVYFWVVLTSLPKFWTFKSLTLNQPNGILWLVLFNNTYVSLPCARSFVT